MFRNTVIALAAVGALSANDRYVTLAQGSRQFRGIVNPKGRRGCKPKDSFWTSKLIPGCPGPRPL